MRIFRPKYRDRRGKKKQLKMFWVEFRGPDRQIRKFSLGTAAEDVAEIVRSQLSSLNEWAKKKVAPPGDLVKWAREQELKLRNKIYESGLLKGESANQTRPLKEDLRDYVNHLMINSKGNYPEQVKSCIERIIEGCGFRFWVDVEGIKVNQFISRLVDEGMGRHTAQHYINAFKSFANWMKKQGRINETPVVESMKYDVPPQRPFEEDEFAALCEATRKGPVIYGLTGWERYVLYKLGFDSGLRRNELRSLTRNSFNFEKCTVLVPGTDTKNDNEAYQKITPETAALVREIARDKMPDTKMFKIHDHSNVMIRKDCEAAGIETTNWKGTIKFYSLRHSLASHLANKGVPPHVLKKIMRHADIKTTMRYYTHLLRGAEDAAIDKLRGFGERRAKEQTA